MRFRYLRDPVFVGCLVLYFANRWLIKELVADGFFHDYLNDLICIPFWVPIMVFGLRKVGLRSDDGPPRADEILIPLLMWSVAFELWLPSVGRFERLVVADHVDVFCYAAGALAAALFWQTWYGKRRPAESRLRAARPSARSLPLRP